MDHKEAHLHQEIERTRAAISAKIDILKAQVDAQVDEVRSSIIAGMTALLEKVNQVRAMIDHATSTVEATIEQAQETAHTPLEADFAKSGRIGEFDQAPWVMISTAILIGYVLGAGDQLLLPRRVPTAGPVPDARVKCFPTSYPTSRSRSATTSSAHSHSSPSTSAREAVNPPPYEL